MGWLRVRICSRAEQTGCGSYDASIAVRYTICRPVCQLSTRRGRHQLVDHSDPRQRDPQASAPSATFAGPVTASLNITTVANLAPLLTSGLAVQIRDELDFSETALGVTVGGFFLVGALSSAVSGRVVERVGPQAALRLSARVTAVVLLGIGLFARSWLLLTIFVACAGLANAWSQPATNLYIARGVAPERHGIALGIQKSGVPMASLLGGLAVPTVGLTIGWSWAFVFGAILALVASTYIPPIAGEEPKLRKKEAALGPAPRPDVPTRLLVVLAIATGLAACGSSALSSFFVLTSVETGMREAVAGILLVAGSMVGIGARLALGLNADRGSRNAWNTLTIMFAIAALSFVAIATGSKTMLLLAMPFAFATGFAWPSLYHLAVVRANPSAPGAATGITMTGSFTGAVSGPLIFGVLAEHASYAWAWSFAVVAMAAAAMVIVIAGRLIQALTKSEVQA